MTTRGPWAWVGLWLGLAAGCTQEGASDAGVDVRLRDGAGDGAAASPCRRNLDCSDGVYCNGVERCAPDEELADERGCVSGLAPCAATDRCEDAEERCVPAGCTVLDSDSDGVLSVACGGTDCDDLDPDRFPGHSERCSADGHDEDCDPCTVRDALRDGDQDQDGFVSSQCFNRYLGVLPYCPSPSTRVDSTAMEIRGADCNDQVLAIRPGQTEACNAVDDNCDGQTDEGVQRSFYPDRDFDGYGERSSAGVAACNPPAEYVENALDCNDAEATVRPGVLETCDGVDNDCDGQTDEAGAERACNPGILHTAWACEAGLCKVNSCATDFGDCDQDPSNGCETDLRTTPEHCGACGAACGVGGSCAASACDQAAQVAAGSGFTCVRRSGGRVVCFGANSVGQLGLGDRVGRQRPTLVSDLENVSFLAPGATGLLVGISEHNCVVADGQLFCTGRNTEGQLGDGTFASPRLRFGPASGCGTGSCAGTVSLGMLHTCAQAPGQSSVYCWGGDTFGQLGLGGTGGPSQNLPKRVLGSSFRQISAGASHTCGVTTTGSLSCWGWALGGQLGNGSSNLENVGTPTTVCANGGSPCTAFTNAAEVRASSGFTCARKTNGTVWCWGIGGDGVLGNGTTPTESLVPVQVSGLNDATALSVGMQSACAIRSTGTVVCWGGNYDGQLGDNSTTNRSTPVSLLVGREVLSNVVELSMGRSHACARTNTQAVYCWGDNSSGQLGQGDLVRRLTATLVPGL